MANILLKANESMMVTNWGYIFNAGYFYIPSKIKKSYTDIHQKCIKE